jgi:hypothetical protein
MFWMPDQVRHDDLRTFYERIKLFSSGRRNDMEDLLKQFKALTNEEKIAFMKEAMPLMAEIFSNDPQKMMAEMMPFCMNMMRSKGMDMDKMRSMRKNMMGQS